MMHILLTLISLLLTNVLCDKHDGNVLKTRRKFEGSFTRWSSFSSSGEKYPSHHLNKSNGTGKRECASFRHYTNQSTVCEYVSTRGECVFDQGYIQYMQFPFCELPPKYYPIAYVIMSLWLIYMFIALGVVAEEFFCPCLKSISKTLHMSDSVAGVTLLALGNGAPDIFSVIAAISNEDANTSSLAFQELFGAGIFVTSVVSGCINICVSFKMARRPFLRDVLFYLTAAAWTFAVMYKKDIRTTEAIGFIVLYVLYVLIVIVGQVVNRYVRKQPGKFQRLLSVANMDEHYQHEIPQNVTHIVEDLNASADFTSYNYSTDHAHLLKHNIHVPSQSRKPTSPLAMLAAQAYVIINQDITDSVRIHDETTNISLGEILTGIIKLEWPHQSLVSKVYSIIKMPIVFILSVTCPIVDRDVQGEKWNKWLSLVLCVTTPLFSVFVLKVAFIRIYNVFLVWHLVLILCIVATGVMYRMTSFNTAPKFHFVFAFIGFVVAVVWIKSLAQEIVNLLQSFGWIFGLSYGIMGLTFLAWGNSIGDFISNLTMARHGAPRMAIAACYGGPLLNMLLGIGISCTMTAIRNNGDKKLIRGTTQYILSASFLSLSLMSALISLPVNRFHSNKYIGFYLLVLYAAYITLSVLHETGLLHFEINI